MWIFTSKLVLISSPDIEHKQTDRPNLFIGGHVLDFCEDLIWNSILSKKKNIFLVFFCHNLHFDNSINIIWFIGWFIVFYRAVHFPYNMIIQEILSGFDLYLAKLELSEKNIEITLKGTVSGNFLWTFMQRCPIYIGTFETLIWSTLWKIPSFFLTQCVLILINSYLIRQRFLMVLL